MQDTPTWFLMPKQVTYYISKDGKNFKTVGAVPNVMEANNYEIQTEKFPLKIKKQKARFIKVKADNYGTLPDWHAGKGYEAFIFVDEIEIN